MVRTPKPALGSIASYQSSIQLDMYGPSPAESKETTPDERTRRWSDMLEKHTGVTAHFLATGGLPESYPLGASWGKPLA